MRRQTVCVMQRQKEKTGCPCPADGHTKREYVKNLTKQLNKDNPGIKERLFHAVISGNIEGWNSGNIGMDEICHESDRESKNKKEEF